MTTFRKFDFHEKFAETPGKFDLSMFEIHFRSADAANHKRGGARKTGAHLYDLLHQQSENEFQTSKNRFFPAFPRTSSIRLKLQAGRGAKHSSQIG